MSNAIFPTLPGLAWDVKKSPTYEATQVVRSVSGREVRGTCQQFPIYEIALQYEFLQDGARGTDLDALMAFFLARGGDFDSFLFLDPTDSTVTAQPIGVGTGAATQFQLARSLAGGGYSYTEPVNNPASIASVTVGGVATTAYTVNATGLLTFTTAPANGAAIAWTGTYYYRVRFMSGRLEFRNFMRDLWDLQQVAFRGSVVSLV